MVGWQREPNLFTAAKCSQSLPQPVAASWWAVAASNLVFGWSHVLWSHCKHLLRLLRLVVAVSGGGTGGGCIGTSRSGASAWDSASLDPLPWNSVTQCLRTPPFVSIVFRAGLPRNSNPEYGPVPCGCFSWRGKDGPRWPLRLSALANTETFQSPDQTGLYFNIDFSIFLKSIYDFLPTRKPPRSLLPVRRGKGSAGRGWAGSQGDKEALVFHALWSYCRHLLRAGCQELSLQAFIARLLRRAGLGHRVTTRPGAAAGALAR